MKKVGVLALQGAFEEHVKIIKSLGHKPVEVRKVEELDGLDGIILPGGESTVMGKLLVDFNIKEKLVEVIKSGLPVWGTCAGMILLAKELDDGANYLKVMDIKVKRNAYGRQVDSFMSHEIVDWISKKPIPMVFIRAPYIMAIGRKVELSYILDGHIVAVKQKNMLATSFHPELTDNTVFHEYFIDMM